MKRYERQRKGENLSMMAMMQAFKWGFGSRNPALTMGVPVVLSVKKVKGPTAFAFCAN